ncbi:MAG: hypothetical protein FJ295_04215 [Planctomycetes bacterium]|nr:hypothetical protein [Planctomycetota bacterium]
MLSGITMFEANIDAGNEGRPWMISRIGCQLRRQPSFAAIFLAIWLLFEARTCGQEAALTVPLVGVDETAVDHIASAVANPAQRKLYVGTLSRDAARTGLWVFDLREDGQPTGQPRKYSDHPDELPAGQHSTVVCLLHDATSRKLYFGVQASYPTHTRGLVMYSLDERGEPRGKPEAFDHGNPNKSCDALTLHPNGRLIAVGWGGEGVFVLDRDEQGRPVGNAIFHRTGGYGGYSVALRRDGTKLYRGTYPSVIEVCDLDARGDVVGKPRVVSIPNGPQEYARIVTTERAIYFRGPDKRLSWFALDTAGEVVGGMQSADIPNLQGVAAASRSDRLLIAVASQFSDTLTNQRITDGVEVHEIALNTNGGPGAVVRKSKRFVRAEAVSLSGGDGVALAAKSLGRGFLGNRIAGLKIRCTLVSLEADGTPLPAMRAIKFGDQSGYLRFAVSAKHSRVYAVVGGEIVSRSLESPTSLGENTSFRGANGDYLGPLALDEARGRLVVARKDGSVAVLRLDRIGMPVGNDETLKTGLASIGAIVVHPNSGVVYAIGAPSGQPLEASGVVSIPAGTHVNDAAIDSERGKLYVVGGYRGRENTSVWTLDERGMPTSAEPRWLADDIPVEKPETRAILSGVKLDAARRKLYIAGAQENPTTQPGYLIVRDLDERGDPTGDPRLFPSANSRGSCLTIELSSDKKRLYESGWGDPTVFVRQLDERGEPSRESTRWSTGQYGKQQLLLAKGAGANRDLLLAGTHPSELELIPLRSAGEPEPGAVVEIAVEGLHRQLGMMASGETSEWIELDAALKNGVGSAVVRCTLGGARVKRATLRWEVAQSNGEEQVPIRTADISLVGNVGAIIVPKYGLDDPVQLKALVRTSAEEFERYREFARKHVVPPAERPVRTLVANGLIGLDASEQALETGMATLAMLGHNSAQIWNWPGVAPETIRAAAERHGIRRFRDAIYNPPSYFHYNSDLVARGSLDKWAAGFRDAASKMGAKPGELELMHIGDEPGWYYPRVTDEVAGDPNRLAIFREYLRSKGLTPADVGADSWAVIRPGKLSEAKSLPQRRLFYWTTRFYAESLSLGFAAATQSLQREVNPKLLTTMNLNNWPGRFYVPSPGVKIANNDNIGPDAGEGMPDWFDLGRKRAVSCIWTEDWFGDAEAQLWSLYGDMLRCSAREGGVEYGGYPVGQSTGAFADGMTLKIASLLGHGAKAIDPYTFGPNLAFADGWSEKEVTYRNLGAAMRLVGKAERLVAPGRPRDGTVAIVFPQASQVWDSDSKTNAYLQELYGLHFALTHENYPVDFVDDFSLEAGDLSRRRYAAIYVTAPNLSLKAQQALLDWTNSGGTLVISPGACSADEYNSPTTLLRSQLGANQSGVERVAPPHFTQAFRIERTPIKVSDAAIGTSTTFAISQTVSLQPTGAVSIASFTDGSAAATLKAQGRGRIITIGFWSGVSYWLSPNRTDITRLPTDWSTEARLFATWPARLANAPRHVITNTPGVEAVLLESDAGLAITLLNWTGQPIQKLAITIPGLKPTSRLTSMEHGPLQRTAGGETVQLPLQAADVVFAE